jgi:hypothetical protein
VNSDPKLENFFSPTFDVASTLYGAVKTDPCTGRISIDPECEWRKMLGDLSSSLVHSLYRVGYETRGLIDFG